MLAEKEDKKMAQVCMDEIQLETEKYRLGHTKVSLIIKSGMWIEFAKGNDKN